MADTATLEATRALRSIREIAAGPINAYESEVARLTMILRLCDKALGDVLGD